MDCRNNSTSSSAKNNQQQKISDADTARAQTEMKLRGEQAFQPFTWAGKPPLSRQSKLLQLAHDVADGIALTLEVVEASDLARDSGGDRIPVINTFNCGILNRYAISSARLLTMALNEEFDLLNAQSRGDAE